MKNILTFLIITILLCGCGQESKTTPSDVMDKNAFVEILMDLHLADAILNDQRLYDNKLSDSTLSYYSYIFIKHGVNRDKFDRSLEWYAYETHEFSIIYDEVVKRMEAKMKTLETPQEIK